MEAVDVDPDVLDNNNTRAYQQNAPQAREGEANVNVMSSFSYSSPLLWEVALRENRWSAVQLFKRQ
jgi:hypothetical protein